ncbi:hypothetical protein AYI69_g2015 [Smittium culicis]|uniref:Uncharacterized protein n=1 Tax=Smittium culicis TaxID=133412 RepID=A0A1R1YNU0_9FUNG|nr:hypothetical protein AYI69_g2015 [Smittium culicis]
MGDTKSARMSANGLRKRNNVGNALSYYSSSSNSSDIQSTLQFPKLRTSQTLPSLNAESKKVPDSTFAVDLPKQAFSTTDVNTHIALSSSTETIVTVTNQSINHDAASATNRQPTDANPQVSTPKNTSAQIDATQPVNPHTTNNNSDPIVKMPPRSQPKSHKKCYSFDNLAHPTRATHTFGTIIAASASANVAPASFDFSPSHASKKSTTAASRVPLSFDVIDLKALAAADVRPSSALQFRRDSVLDESHDPNMTNFIPTSSPTKKSHAGIDHSEILQAAPLISAPAPSQTTAEFAQPKSDSFGLVSEMNSIFDTIIQRTTKEKFNDTKLLMPSPASPSKLSQSSKSKSLNIYHHPISNPVWNVSNELSSLNSISSNNYSQCKLIKMDTKEEKLPKSVNSFINNFDFPVMENLPDFSVPKPLSRLPSLSPPPPETGNDDDDVDDDGGNNNDTELAANNKHQTRFSSIKFKFSQPPIPLNLNTATDSSTAKYNIHKSPKITSPKFNFDESFDPESKNSAHLGDRPPAKKSSLFAFIDRFVILSSITSCFKK